MASLLFHSSRPTVLLRPALAGCRIATYADLARDNVAWPGGDRMIWIDRGLGDPLALATVADVETGSLTVADAVDLMDLWHDQLRRYPTIYHSAGQAAEVTAALGHRRPHHWLWSPAGQLAGFIPTPAVVHFGGEAQLGYDAEVSLVWDEAWQPVSRLLTSAQAALLADLAATAASTVSDLTSAVSTLSYGLRRA